MKPIIITKYSETSHVRKISQAIFEIIKNEDLLGNDLMTIFEEEVRRQIRNTIIQNALTNTVQIDWKNLSRELKIDDPNDTDEMIAILENEIISEMCKGHLLTDYMFSDKSKIGIKEDNNTSKKWMYLAE